VTAAQRARIAVAPEHLRGRHAVPETAWSFAWRTTPNSNALLVRHFAMTQLYSNRPESRDIVRMCFRRHPTHHE
jgi:hypothetical protein